MTGNEDDRQHWSNALDGKLSNKDPANKFPHVNDTKHIQGLIQSMRNKANLVMYGIPLVCGIVGYFVKSYIGNYLTF